MLLQMRPASEGLHANLVREINRFIHVTINEEICEVLVILPASDHERYIQSETNSYSTFPAFSLLLPLDEKLLNVVWMEPIRTVKIHEIVI